LHGIVFLKVWPPPHLLLGPETDFFCELTPPSPPRREKRSWYFTVDFTPLSTVLCCAGVEHIEIPHLFDMFPFLLERSLEEIVYHSAYCDDAGQDCEVFPAFPGCETFKELYCWLPQLLIADNLIAPPRLPGPIDEKGLSFQPFSPSFTALRHIRNV